MGPGRLNFDMGLFKHFKIKESMALEFRAEAFNIFNHPQWTGVNNSSCGYVTDSGSASSGSQDCVNGNADNGEAPSNFLTRVEFIFHASESSASNLFFEQIAMKLRTQS